MRNSHLVKINRPLHHMFCDISESSSFFALHLFLITTYLSLTVLLTPFLSLFIHLRDFVLSICFCCFIIYKLSAHTQSRPYIISLVLCAGDTVAKNSPAIQEMQETQVWSLGLIQGKIPWRKEWLPTPVFLPEKFHGQRSLVGYSPWGNKTSDMTELVVPHLNLEA